jgi:FMN phosphatase YigB (HAD superfamily)
MNSWDCFDTLIARRFYHPKTVFDEVGHRIGDSNFKEKRIAAEKTSDKTYADIYARLPGVDPQIELDVELEHHFPIMENMLKVKDGDLILSDMYLPKEFIEKLLRNCGLTANVDIIVTSNGKKKGWIWEEVTSKYNIETHYGDNKKSDVASAQAHGVNGIYTSAFDFNNIERIVYKHDKSLACWMREIRLQCPYTDERRKNFWKDQADINLPVLALATLELPNTPIAFTYRDCHVWHKLYEAITGKVGYRLDVSRKLYLEPNIYFDKYISFVKEINATIVDMQGKGKSIWNYYKGNPPRTVYIGGITPEYIEQIVPYHTKSMEKHNCFSEGPITDWAETGAVRSENDHPLDAAEVHVNAGKLASLTVKNFKFKRNKDLLLELVKLYDTNNFTNKNIHWKKYNGV